MPRDSAHAPPFPLVVHEPAASPQALARYEAIRPVLTGERSLRPQRQRTGRSAWRLWRDRRRFQRDGLLGLIDRRTLPQVRGKPAVPDLRPRPLPPHLVRLAVAPPFTAREVAPIVRDGYRYPVEHRGIQRVGAQQHLSPGVLQRHHQRAAQVPARPRPAAEQLGRPCEPPTPAQRLGHALGPDHRLTRFRPDRAYPPEGQARWRILG